MNQNQSPAMPPLKVRDQEKAMNQNQLLIMLGLQDRLNSIVNSNWREAGNNWTRAIMVEAVEAVEHHGWKWWKKQEINMPQLQMELVDIMHFMLSAAIENHSGAMEDLAVRLEKNIRMENVLIVFDGCHTFPEQRSILGKLDLMVGMAAVGRISFPLLQSLMTDCKLTNDDMYGTYMAKNILNIFRQENGYKAGAYIKDWSAAPLSHLAPKMAPVTSYEDNDHLHDIMQALPVDTPNYTDVLLSRLQERYDLVVAGNQTHEKTRTRKP